MKTTSTILLSAFALAASTILATAQDNNNPDRNRDRGGDRRGNYEDFQKRMNERLKASLKVTDEEWAVMQPLIEKVQTKQRDAMGSRFGGGRRGGDSNSGNSGPTRPGEAESNALRTAVENEGTSPEEIKAKLAAVRNQRQKATAELTQAREELKKVVTVRQEATLVSMGILE